MNFIVKQYGSPPTTLDITLHDGHAGDESSVYLCESEGDAVYFESKRDAPIWEILNDGILALKEFRKEA